MEWFEWIAAGVERTSRIGSRNQISGKDMCKENTQRLNRCVDILELEL
jgi:hypothetical protein